MVRGEKGDNERFTSLFQTFPICLPSFFLSFFSSLLECIFRVLNLLFVRTETQTKVVHSTNICFPISRSLVILHLWVYRIHLLLPPFPISLFTFFHRFCFFRERKKFTNVLVPLYSSHVLRSHLTKVNAIFPSTGKENSSHKCA